jgi:type IV pilus assembly protein PilN
MRLPLNLASEPFRRDRPIFVASIAVSAVLAVLLTGLVYLVVLERDRAADARAALARLEADVAKLDREQAAVSRILTLPENAAVIERSLFLNALLSRKGISWTKVFSDLETVLPHNVRIISVRPQVSGASQIQLDLLVGASEPQPVIDFFMRLESSPLFGRTTVASGLPPSQTEPLYRYRLTVNYAQKL